MTKKNGVRFVSVLKRCELGLGIDLSGSSHSVRKFALNLQLCRRERKQRREDRLYIS